jgi:hypothetical protein
MKKHILLFLFVCSFSMLTNAQSSREQKLLDKMCKEACENINNTEFKSSDARADIELKLGMALIPTFQTNADEIKQVWGLDASNPDDSRALGEKIGGKLVMVCDKFKQIVLNLESGNANTDQTTATCEGAISRVECSIVCEVMVKTANGDIVKMLWLEKFSGSEMLENMNANTSKIKVTVTYKEISIYNSKVKSYVVTKVITGLEKI